MQFNVQDAARAFGEVVSGHLQGKLDADALLQSRADREYERAAQEADAEDRSSLESFKLRGDLAQYVPLEKRGEYESGLAAEFAGRPSREQRIYGRLQPYARSRYFPQGSPPFPASGGGQGVGLGGQTTAQPAAPSGLPPQPIPPSAQLQGPALQGTPYQPQLHALMGQFLQAAGQHLPGGSALLEGLQAPPPGSGPSGAGGALPPVPDRLQQARPGEVARGLQQASGFGSPLGITPAPPSASVPPTGGQLDLNFPPRPLPAVGGPLNLNLQPAPPPAAQVGAGGAVGTPPAPSPAQTYTNIYDRLLSRPTRPTLTAGGQEFEFAPAAQATPEEERKELVRRAEGVQALIEKVDPDYFREHPEIAEHQAHVYDADPAVSKQNIAWLEQNLPLATQRGETAKETAAESGAVKDLRNRFTPVLAAIRALPSDNANLPALRRLMPAMTGALDSDEQQKAALAAYAKANQLLAGSGRDAAAEARKDQERLSLIEHPPKTPGAYQVWKREYERVVGQAAPPFAQLKEQPDALDAEAARLRLQLLTQQVANAKQTHDLRSQKTTGKPADELKEGKAYAATLKKQYAAADQAFKTANPAKTGFTPRQLTDPVVAQRYASNPTYQRAKEAFDLRERLRKDYATVLESVRRLEAQKAQKTGFPVPSTGGLTPEQQQKIKGMTTQQLLQFRQQVQGRAGAP